MRTSLSLPCVVVFTSLLISFCCLCSEAQCQENSVLIPQLPKFKKAFPASPKRNLDQMENEIPLIEESGSSTRGSSTKKTPFVSIPATVSEMEVAEKMPSIAPPSPDDKTSGLTLEEQFDETLILLNTNENYGDKSSALVKDLAKELNLRIRDVANQVDSNRSEFRSGMRHIREDFESLEDRVNGVAGDMASFNGKVMREKKNIETAATESVKKAFLAELDKRRLKARSNSAEVISTTRATTSPTPRPSTGSTSKNSGMLYARYPNGVRKSLPMPASGSFPPCSVCKSTTGCNVSIHSRMSQPAPSFRIPQRNFQQGIGVSPSSGNQEFSYATPSGSAVITNRNCNGSCRTGQ